MIYNCKVLKYADSTHIEFFENPVHRKDEKIENTITNVTERKKIQIIEDLQNDLKKEHSTKVSVNRSKNNLYRIARSNNWEWFITITFDRKITDASDYMEVAKKITTFFNNQRKRGSPDLKYLLVPEFHKDGKNYHFHGLLANCNFTMIDSGHKDSFGNEIYNISDWKIGFTTASKIKDNGKVTNYIGKYITKELLNRLKYKKRYFASRNCDVVEEEFLNIHPEEFYKMFGVDFDYLKTVNISDANQRIKYIEINNKD